MIGGIAKKRNEESIEGKEEIRRQREINYLSRKREDEKKGKGE